MKPAKNNKNQSFPTVRASVLRPLLACFGNAPHQQRALLKTAGIPKRLTDDPYASISFRTYLSLFEAAVIATKDPLLGAKLGFAVRPGDLGPSGLLMAQAGTIFKGLQVFTRFISALQTSTTIVLNELDEHFIWAYRIEGPLEISKRQDSEFTLACVCGLIRSLFDPKWRPVEVHFEHSSNDNDNELKKIFGTDIKFDQAINRLIVDKDQATQIYRLEDRDLIALIERHLSDLVLKDTQNETSIEQVKLLIRLHLGIRPISLTDIAEILHVLPRTLQRRLIAEGTNFRNLLTHERVKVANTMLHESNASISQIASTLGYADATVFWRSYKEHTGHSPTEERLKGPEKPQKPSTRQKP